MINLKSKRIILAGILLLIFMSPIFVFAADSGAITGTIIGKVTEEVLTFTPNVPIGEFKGKMNVNEILLGRYIQAWYSFVVGTVGIIATVIIMWGGFKWLTSRGNSAAIADAKDRIWSAVIGLILVFLSYTIFYLLNPKLLILDLPRLDTLVVSVTTGGEIDSGLSEEDQKTLNRTVWQSLFKQDLNTNEGIMGLNFSGDLTLSGNDFVQTLTLYMNESDALGNYSFDVSWNDNIMTNEEVADFVDILSNSPIYSPDPIEWIINPIYNSDGYPVLINIIPTLSYNSGGW